VPKRLQLIKGCAEAQGKVLGQSRIGPCAGAPGCGVEALQLKMAMSVRQSRRVFRGAQGFDAYCAIASHGCTSLGRHGHVADSARGDHVQCLRN